MNVLITAIVLTAFASCKSKKAIEFNEALAQKEREITHIVLGENSLEQQKLEYILKKDYNGALRAIDKQEQAFDALIGKIDSLPVAGIEHADTLKKAVINYYTAVKELQIFDRREITERIAAQSPNKDSVDNAYKRLLQISVEKRKMYDKVYKEDEALGLAKDAFTKAHGL